MSNTNVLAPPFEAALEPGRKVGEAFGFPSRRSVVHSAGAMVACSQPLAARCGVRILEKGGNSAVSPLSELCVGMGMLMFD